MRNAGFTLVELMIALVIMAIIAAIALPLYTQFSDRTFRTEAQADLLDCAQALERFASITFSYENAADTDADGIGDSDGPGLIASQICTPSSVAATRYVVTVVGSATAFTLFATPQGNLAADGMLTYDSTGARGWDHNGDMDTADADEQTWEES